MKLILSKDFIAVFPGITISAIVFKNINNSGKKSIIEQLLRGVAAQKKSELKNKDKKEKLSELLKDTLNKENSLKESLLLDSLLKKAIKNSLIKPVNTATDLLHYLMIKYETPLQAFDLDQVEKDLKISFSKKKADISLSEETNHIVIWFVDIGKYSKEEFLNLHTEFIKTLQKYCGGEAETFVISAENPEVDLEYVSEKEKNYLEEKAKMKIETHPIARDNSQNEGAKVDAAQRHIKPESIDLKKKLQETIFNILKNISEVPLNEISFSTPAEESHGDLATSVALKIGKILQKPPQEIATQIQKSFPDFPEIEKIEIAGPGFINFYFSKKYLQDCLKNILQQKENFGQLENPSNERILIEYSQPNIAKPLGVHHLLSTIIGQTLVNLFRFGGLNIWAINYPGDWGTQFGKLIYAYRNWGNEEIVKKDPLNELLKLYVRFHKEVETDPALDDKGRAEFKKLEEGDNENLQLWQWIKDLSIEEIERIYKKLGVKFDEYLSESMYRNDTGKILEQGKEKGIFIEGEKGALIVKFEDDKLPPFMVQKSDGTTLYSTRDIVSIKDRIDRLKAKKIIYVVDVAQSLHFKQLFETAKKFEFNGAELVHVSHGRMQFPEGRMSTRKGEIILLDEVIKEAKARTEKLIQEKSAELPEEEKKYIAENMAISAIKYNVISQNRETNMTFNWDKILSLDGNSGPYIQYTCARAKSILRRHSEASAASERINKSAQNESQISLFDQEQSIENLFDHPLEQKIIKLLNRFPDAISQAIKEYKPHLVSNYLFELARTFNSFYNEVPVLTAKTESLKEARLELTQGIAQVMENGLKVLGIVVFERM